MLLPLTIVQDSEAKIVVVRQTMTQQRQLGNTFDTAQSIVKKLPKHQQPRIRDHAAEFIWPSGAKQRFSYLDLEKDLDNYQGGAFSMIIVDEATQVKGNFLVTLTGRLRSAAKTPSRMVMTCNPKKGHWVHNMIRWYLDDNGYPIEERQGVLRYYLRIDGDVHWGATPQELKDKFGDDKKPVSFSFVQLLVTDNIPLLKSNPNYLAQLEAMNPTEQAIYRWGCWEAVEQSANYFKREWLLELPNIPQKCTWVRSWDLAGTERTVSYKSPDFTAGIKVGKTQSGDFVLVGDYCKDNYDPETETYGRFCKRSGSRDVTILRQAEHDGDDCLIVLPQDPGSAGKGTFMQQVKFFSGEGYISKSDPVANNKSKLARFTPFATASEQGMVYIVKSTFDTKTYEAIMKELEAFDGTRSTSDRHDDFVDAIASGFNYLSNTKIKKPVRMPSLNTPTMATRY